MPKSGRKNHVKLCESNDITRGFWNWRIAHCFYGITDGRRGQGKDWLAEGKIGGNMDQNVIWYSGFDCFDDRDMNKEIKEEVKE